MTFFSPNALFLLDLDVGLLPITFPNNVARNQSCLCMSSQSPLVFSCWFVGENNTERDSLKSEEQGTVSTRFHFRLHCNLKRGRTIQDPRAKPMRKAGPDSFKSVLSPIPQLHYPESLMNSTTHSHTSCPTQLLIRLSIAGLSFTRNLSMR